MAPTWASRTSAYEIVRQIKYRLRTALQAHNAEQAPPRWPWTMTTPINVDRDLSQPDQPEDEFAYWSN